MKKNILVVEDNKKSREMLVDMLSEIDKDLTVFETDNIDAAYRYALQSTIHLFLLDIILDTSVRGDLSGIVFASEMRSLSRYKQTPIIFITSLEDPQLFSYSELHCYQYIEKPFDRNKTVRIIKEALGIAVEEKRSKHLFFRKEGLVFPIKVEDIVYIAFEKPVTTIFLKNDFLEIPYISIKKMMIKLDSADFGQCSRNAVVNRNYIEYLDLTDNVLKIKDRDIVLRIGDVYKNKFLSGLEND